MDFNKSSQLIASKFNLETASSSAMDSEELEKFPSDSDDTEAVLNEK